MNTPQIIFFILSMNLVVTGAAFPSPSTRTARDIATSHLGSAARQGDIESVKELLAQGANVNGQDDHGWTALMAVLDNGMKPPSQVPQLGLPSLVYMDTVRFLLTRGADVNAKTELGVTPLMLALSNGQTEAVTLLLTHGADVNARNSVGKSPLMYAISDSHTAQEQTAHTELLLARGADANARDDAGDSALSRAAQNAPPAVVQALLDAGASGDTQRAIRLAAYGSRLDNVKVLLASASDSDGRHITHRVLATSALLSAQGYTQAGKDTVRFLVEQGADVNVKGSQGGTPLMAEVDIGSLDMLQYLLAHGADVNAKDNDGNTAFRAVARYLAPGPNPYNAHEQELGLVAEFLLTHGADINSQDKNGKTLVADAATEGNLPLLRFLLARKEDAHFLLPQKADVNLKDNSGQTPLMMALEQGETNAASLLLDNGADVRARNPRGETPLLIALRTVAGAEQRHQPDIVPLLIAHGADVKAQDKNKWTALLVAINARLNTIARNPSTADIAALIASGADVNAKIPNGGTLLHGAEQSRDDRVVALLKKAGARE